MLYLFMISHYINSDHSFLYLSTILWLRTPYVTTLTFNTTGKEFHVITPLSRTQYFILDLFMG